MSGSLENIETCPLPSSKTVVGDAGPPHLQVILRYLSNWSCLTFPDNLTVKMMRRQTLLMTTGTLAECRQSHQMHYCSRISHHRDHYDGVQIFPYLPNLQMTVTGSGRIWTGFHPKTRSWRPEIDSLACLCETAPR